MADIAWLFRRLHTTCEIARSSRQLHLPCARMRASLAPSQRGDPAVRLPILDPKELSDEQKPLYADMQAGIKDHFKGFVNMRDDGALLGPWNPWTREPRFGGPVKWSLMPACISA